MSANQTHELLRMALERREARCREDFTEFCGTVMRDSRGKPLVLASLHRTWILHAEACWAAGIKPAILAPMAHGKSSLMVVARAAFEIGSDPNIRIKIISNTDGTAKKRVMEVARVLTMNAAYRRVFPWVVPVPPSPVSKSLWTQHELQVRRQGTAIDPTLIACGVLATGAGGRSDLHIYDDICDLRNSIDNPTLRPRVTENFEDTWETRLDAHGRSLYIGTPWHEADTTHVLMRKPGWCVLRQWVSADFSCIEQEVHGVLPQSYPIPRAIPRAERKPPRASPTMRMAV